MKIVLFTDAGEEGAAHVEALAQFIRTRGSLTTLLFDVHEDRIEPVRPDDFLTATWYAEAGGADVVLVYNATDDYVALLEEEAYKTFGEDYEFPWDTLVSLKGTHGEGIGGWVDIEFIMPVTSDVLFGGLLMEGLMDDE